MIMKHDLSPTARALVLLELIQNSPGITAARLADKLAVSERAARRYVGILREAGVPIESVRGPYGGYRVGRGLRLPPLMFSAGEALGLVMAVLDGHHDAASSDDPVGSAIGKIIRALPEAVARPAEVMRRLSRPAPDRAAIRPDLETTAALAQACEARRRLRLHYGTGSGDSWEVEVDPWAVVVRHGRWYLLCWSHQHDAVRTLRVDRVHDFQALEQEFRTPTDLDPVQTLEDHLAIGWAYRTEVIIRAPRDEVVGCIPRGIGRCDAVDAHTTRLSGTTDNPDWYAAQLTELRAPLTVVGGPELRAATRALAKRLTAAVD
jgi:predicted DNA-binding transcriptional regulator YafY